jgi:hypothetical protein
MPKAKSKSTVNVNKNPPGRPKKVGGSWPVFAVRIPATLIEAIDEWADAKGLTRSEATQRLVEAGLRGKK